jgi:integrase
MPMVNFLKSKQGIKLKTPVSVNIPETQNETEKKLQEYIIQACINKMPRLLPFVLENNSMMEFAERFFLHSSGKQETFKEYTRKIFTFCKWANNTPDKIIASCRNEDLSPNLKGIEEMERTLDEYALILQSSKIAPNTLLNSLRSIKSLFRSNYVNVKPYYHRPAVVIYEVRAPTLEELRILINGANLRERLIVAMLATSGLRTGTLTKLKYRHVKFDLERNVIPVHLDIESEITKGKYHSYCTFFNEETVEYLSAYLQARRIGTPYIPPEEINDDSPLIRPQRKDIRPISPLSLQRGIHKLYFRTGILIRKPATTRYDVTAHALRKFFRTQMAFLGVEKEYIEYMIGHKTDTYFDAKMKGVEYLRHVYEKSAISIRPQAEIGKLTLLRELIFKLGLNPSEVLNPNISSQVFMQAKDNGGNALGDLHI